MHAGCLMIDSVVPLCGRSTVSLSDRRESQIRPLHPYTRCRELFCVSTTEKPHAARICITCLLSSDSFHVIYLALLLTQPRAPQRPTLPPLQIQQLLQTRLSASLVGLAYPIRLLYAATTTHFQLANYVDDIDCGR